MRRRLFARLKALLTNGACRDVVERVESMYVQLSLISSAGHPLHQAGSYLSHFFEKRGRQKKKKLSRKKENKGKLNQNDFKESWEKLFSCQKKDKEEMQKDMEVVQQKVFEKNSSKR